LQTAVDWHADGYTTRVKEQGLCGCCWAVSTAAAIESALLITNQIKVSNDLDRESLSFQQMISCDDRNSGCGGGNILYATKYAWENNDFGNEKYADYPYVDYLGITSETCQLPKSKNAQAYLNYPKIRRDVTMAAVAQQPIASTLTTGCDLFISYGGGVLTHDEGSSCIDHAVVIVGYNTTAKPPYWKVRNSWGPEWGEEGHFKV
ncbi:predicted protein, partial [Thalassiosira pseudonana CCMP1335]